MPSASKFQLHVYCPVPYLTTSKSYRVQDAAQWSQCHIMLLHWAVSDIA
jgi:hypothetical protein